MKRYIAALAMILLAGCVAESTVTRSAGKQGSASNVVSGDGAVADSSAPRGWFRLAGQARVKPVPPEKDNRLADDAVLPPR